MAYIGIFLDRAMSNPRAVAALQKVPEVLECHYTTGKLVHFDKSPLQGQ